MNEQEIKALNDAIVNAVETYNHNLPDILEVIVQITFRELYKQCEGSKQSMNAFRDQLIELAELN